MGGEEWQPWDGDGLDVSGPVIAGSGPRVFVFPSSPNKASFSRFVVGRAREFLFASSVIYIRFRFGILLTGSLVARFFGRREIYEI